MQTLTYFKDKLALETTQDGFEKIHDEIEATRNYIDSITGAFCTDGDAAYCLQCDFESLSSQLEILMHEAQDAAKEAEQEAEVDAKYGSYFDQIRSQFYGSR